MCDWSENIKFKQQINIYYYKTKKDPSSAEHFHFISV